MLLSALTYTLSNTPHPLITHHSHIYTTYIHTYIHIYINIYTYIHHTHRYELGKISNHMWNLKIGDMLDVRGPVGRFKYKKNAHKQIGLIAGGSGLTPCLQVCIGNFE